MKKNNVTPLGLGFFAVGMLLSIPALNAQEVPVTVISVEEVPVAGFAGPVAVEPALEPGGTAVSKDTKEWRDYYKKFKDALYKDDNRKLDELLADKSALDKLPSYRLMKIMYTAFLKNNNKVVDFFLQPPYGDKLTQDDIMWIMGQSIDRSKKRILERFLQSTQLDKLNEWQLQEIFVRAVEKNNQEALALLLKSPLLDKVLKDQERMPWFIRAGLNSKNNKLMLDTFLVPKYLTVWTPGMLADLLFDALYRANTVVLDKLLKPEYLAKLGAEDLVGLVRVAVEQNNTRIVDMLLQEPYIGKIKQSGDVTWLISAAAEKNSAKILDTFLQPAYLDKISVDRLANILTSAIRENNQRVQDVLLRSPYLEKLTSQENQNIFWILSTALEKNNRKIIDLFWKPERLAQIPADALGSGLSTLMFSALGGNNKDFINLFFKEEYIDKVPEWRILDLLFIAMLRGIVQIDLIVKSIKKNFAQQLERMVEEVQWRLQNVKEDPRESLDQGLFGVVKKTDIIAAVKKSLELLQAPSK